MANLIIIFYDSLLLSSNWKYWVQRQSQNKMFCRSYDPALANVGKIKGAKLFTDLDNYVLNNNHTR